MNGPRYVSTWSDTVMPRKLAASNVIIFILGVCSVQPVSADASPTRQQSALLDSVCTSIMILHRGEYSHTMCRNSLAQSLAQKTAAEARVRSYDACLRHGYKEGSPAFSVCILETPELTPAALSGANDSPPQLVPWHDDPYPHSNYNNVTPEVRWGRERYACAQLGLIAGGPAFQQCVVDLDANVPSGRD